MYACTNCRRARQALMTPRHPWNKLVILHVDSAVMSLEPDDLAAAFTSLGDCEKFLQVATCLDTIPI